MFENEILDEGFLRELIKSELEIDIEDIKPATELEEDEENSVVGTFANQHEAKLFHSILLRMGIKSRVNVDPTMGNMDPLFNTGTQMLLTDPDDIKDALKIIEAVDRNIEKHQKEKGSADYSKFLFATIIITVIAILLMYLLLRSSGSF
ncbi:MAG: hypothetical protein AAF502_10360 [Bacteroidota bacterium]